MIKHKTPNGFGAEFRTDMGRIAGPQLELLQNADVIMYSSQEDINASSIDLHLGTKFLVEKRPSFFQRLLITFFGIYPKHATLEKGAEFGPDMEEVDGQIVLYPGQRCLAETAEVFNLPDTISAEVRLRSTCARRGLDHAFASWADAGWHGSVLTLEFTNTNRWTPIILREGDRAVQMIFEAHANAEKYSYRNKGRYNNSSSVEAGK